MDSGAIFTRVCAGVSVLVWASDSHNPALGLSLPLARQEPLGRCDTKLQGKAGSFLSLRKATLSHPSLTGPSLFNLFHRNSSFFCLSLNSKMFARS